LVSRLDTESVPGARAGPLHPLRPLPFQAHFWKAFNEQQIRFVDTMLFDSLSLGPTALHLSRIKALRWQVDRNVSWLVMMEDDVAVRPGFTKQVPPTATSWGHTPLPRCCPPAPPTAAVHALAALRPLPTAADYRSPFAAADRDAGQQLGGGG